MTQVEPTLAAPMPPSTIDLASIFAAHAGVLETRGLDIGGLDGALVTIQRLGRIFNELMARPAPEAPSHLRDQAITVRAAAAF